MWRNKLTPAEKLIKKIAKLRGKGKFAQAVALQRELCQEQADQPQHFRDLILLAGQARLLEVELRARITLATLERAGVEEWLALAQLCERAGLATEVVEVTFRAADAAAVAADCTLAMTLCDRVLERQPDHSAARRIRGLMARRLEREKEEEEERRGGGWNTREPTRTFAGLPSEWPAEHALYDAGEEMESSGTLTEWPPTGSRRAPGSLEWQLWPTLLQEQSLLFAGELGRLAQLGDLQRLAEPLEVARGEAIFEQGHLCDLLYAVDHGVVRVSSDRAEAGSTCTISEGMFFGDAGALSNLPASSSPVPDQDCVLRVVSRRRLRELAREGAEVQAWLGILKSIYLDAVLELSPLFAGFAPENLEELVKSFQFVSVPAGGRLAEPGCQGPLQVLVAGVAEVTLEKEGQVHSLGLLVPGDLVGELQPCAVAVTAVRDVLAINLDRAVLEHLPEPASRRIDYRVQRCREALADPQW